MEYIIPTTVTNVEQRFHRYHVAGFGENAIFKTQPEGWWIHASNLAFYVGEERPDLAAGDHVIIRISKDAPA